MNDNLNDVLATLALKVGETVPHLYDVIARQALVKTTADMTLFLVYAGALYKLRPRTSSSNAGNYAVLKFIWWCVVCVSFMFGCGITSSFVTAIFNPEYWALTHIPGITNAKN